MNKDQWIKVTDRLPEPKIEVLCVRDFTKWRKGCRDIRAGYMHVADKAQPYGGPRSLVGSGIIPTGEIYWSFPCVETKEIVTHWMPLPELPNE